MSKTTIALNGGLEITHGECSNTIAIKFKDKTIKLTAVTLEELVRINKGNNEFNANDWLLNLLLAKIGVV